MALAAIGFESVGSGGGSIRLAPRLVHPANTWIDGWNLNLAYQVIRALGDLDGDGRTEAVITSDWGLGLIRCTGGRFSLAAAMQRDTIVSRWIYDASRRLGRDRIRGIDIFSALAGARPDILLWSAAGAALIGLDAGDFSLRRRPTLPRLGTQYHRRGGA